MDQRQHRPYVPPHVLIGLGHVVSPSKARGNINSGNVLGIPDDKIKKSLRMAAITIHNHQTLAQRYKSKVCSGKSPLPFLVCALHGHEAPTAPPLTLSPHRLNQTSLLPLCHWASLYYAIVAEIKEIYCDIQQRFETDFEKGLLVLHTSGWDGNESGKPFTALDLASQLEELWLVCMDPRLLGPLENSVRNENATEACHIHFGDAAHPGQFESNPEDSEAKDMGPCLDDMGGMLDATSLPTNDIIDMIWEKHAPTLRRACRENFNIDIDLADQRATLQSAHVRFNNFTRTSLTAIQEQLPQTSPPIESTDMSCSCSDECQCRLVCQFEIVTASCDCKGVVGLRNWPVKSEQEHQYKSHRYEHESSTGLTNPVFSATGDGMVPMPMGGSEPRNYHTSFNNHEDKRSADANERPMRRGRSNTEGSDLAFVPGPRTQPRGKKEQFPLGFYSPDLGPYPRFRSESQAPSPPDYEPSAYSTTMPIREPMLPPLSSFNTSSDAYNKPISSAECSDTLPSSSPPESSPISRIRYPDISKLTTKPTPTPAPESTPVPPFAPPSKLDSRLTVKKKWPESEPVRGTTNPCDLDNEFADWDTSNMETPNLNPMKIDFGHSSSQVQPLPLGRHSEDWPSPRGKALPSTTARLDEFAEPQLGVPSLGMAPVGLPDPDFIAPRPAVKQRYFSAGGDAKLKDRQELVGFTLPKSELSEMTMKQPELLKKLNDTSFTAPRRDSGAATPRSSQEQAPSSSRSSREVENVMHGEKRGRTGSGSNLRALKRVFSRQNSSTDQQRFA